MAKVHLLHSLGWYWRENGVELCINLDGNELRVFVPLGRVIVQFHRELEREGYTPPARVEGWSVGGFFDDVVSAAKSIGKGAARAVSRAASTVTRTAARYGAAALRPISRYGGAALRAVSNNPFYSAIQTAASFVPGLGTAVSSGMATAAALGRGASLRDAGLAAAKAALPGGPAAAAAFDIAIGLAKGQRLDRIALNAARNQLPGGPIAQAAFDAGVTAVQRGPAAALRSMPASAARMLPPAARAFGVPSYIPRSLPFGRMLSASAMPRPLGISQLRRLGSYQNAQSAFGRGLFGRFG